MRIKGMPPRSFLQTIATGYRRANRPKALLLCIADHYEPEWGRASKQLQYERVRRWTTEYPKLFSSLKDTRGRPPQHTFFYPAEVYDPKHLELLAELVHAGFGEVEVHLHHDNDNAERLREFLLEYVAMLNDQHGLLTRDSSGNIRFGFIHGNWAWTTHTLTTVGVGSRMKSMCSSKLAAMQTLRCPQLLMPHRHPPSIKSTTLWMTHIVRSRTIVALVPKWVADRPSDRC